MAIYQKNDNGIRICRHNLVVNFYWRSFVSLVKPSYWLKFHVSIITGSGVMTTFFYKGLIRNLEIGNTHIQVWPNLWRLKQVRDTNFGTNVSNQMLLNSAKCECYIFHRFWVIKGKPTRERGGKGIKLPSPTQTRVKMFPYLFV